MVRAGVHTLGFFAVAALSVTLAQCSDSGGSAETIAHRTPVPKPTPTAPGGIIIAVPTPAPVRCTPAPIAVAVGQQVLVTCTAAGYVGPFTWMVADPTIATVNQFNGETFTVFTAVGLKAGNTTLSLESVPGGTGSDAIVVSP
jgi:hypothetical protein